MTTHLCIHGDLFTQTQPIVDWIASRTGWPVVSDQDLVEAAGKRFALPPHRLGYALMKPEGVLNRLTHGAELAMASVQSVMVDKLSDKTTIFNGTLGLATSRQLPQVLNVLVTAPTRFRVKRACQTQAMTERQARSLIRQEDHREFEWCRYAFSDDRFDTDTYDLVIASDRLDTESAGSLILEQLMRTQIQTPIDAANRLADLKLACQVWVNLAKGGHRILVAARNDHIHLTVHRPVLFFDRLARKLKQQMMQMKGVRRVQIDVGPDFFQSDIYRRCRFELPAEAEFSSFVQCRQRLYDNAAACTPSTAEKKIPQKRLTATRQLFSNASP